MVWALKIQSHKYYTQRVEQSFRVTMAILELTSAENCPVQVMLAFGPNETLFPLCILHKDKVWQVPLNLRIEKGSVVTFTCQGEGCVYLTGYYESNLLKGLELNLDSSAQFSNNKATLEGTENKVRKWIVVDSSSEEEEEEKEDEEESNLEKKRNASKNQTIKDTMPSVNSNENQSNNDNCNENIKNFDDDNDDDNYRNDNTSSLCCDDNNEMNKSENDNDKIKEENKQEEFQKQEENVKQKKRELTEKETNGEQKATKKNKQKKGNIDKRIFICGVQTKKLKSGTGKVAKVGKNITVYYRACAQIGCCKIKIEECLKGDGFTFKVGSRLVIRGVDVGVVGMKVGEKRRLIIPPKMGYGVKGLPPFVPPNATLIYDIELLQVE